MKEHFKQWEWINFLSHIAKSGVFNKANGKDAIENARDAKLFDVLIYASEEQSYELAKYATLERQQNKP